MLQVENVNALLRSNLLVKKIITADINNIWIIPNTQIYLCKYKYVCVFLA